MDTNRDRTENELKWSGENYWIKNYLIVAFDYKDALLCADLLDDGETWNNAELESRTMIVIII